MLFSRVGAEEVMIDALAPGDSDMSLEANPGVILILF